MITVHLTPVAFGVFAGIFLYGLLSFVLSLLTRFLATFIRLRSKLGYNPFSALLRDPRRLPEELKAVRDLEE
jgi:hypothetical protein